MYRGSPSRSTLTTKVIAGLDMCKVCTEAVHREALWKQKLSQVVDMCKVCTEAVHRIAFWKQKLSQVVDMCKVCTEAVHRIAFWKQKLSVITGCRHVESMYRGSPSRSIKHVCKCKRTSSYPPHPTPPPHETSCCVASNMCASANERHHTHPTPPHPHMKHPVA